MNNVIPLNVQSVEQERAARIRNHLTPVCLILEELEPLTRSNAELAGALEDALQSFNQALITLNEVDR